MEKRKVCRSSKGNVASGSPISLGLESEGFEEGVELCALDRAVFAGFEAPQFDIHYALAQQVRGGKAEETAHAADLMFLALGERDRKFSLAESFNRARLRDIAADVYATLHLGLKIRG